MESLVSGTLAGAGSFRCEQCGHVLATSSGEALGACPSCGATHFSRASLFSATGRFDRAESSGAGLVAAAREHIEAPGAYLAYRDGEDLKIVSLDREWTRIGRSLAADVRFDDPTVSRRHALLVRTHDGVRVLDDRSLNGVFVNGDRVEWRMLEDGDEIVVGRYRLAFVEVLETPAETASASSAPTVGA